MEKYNRDLFVVATGSNAEQAVAVAIYDSLDEAKSYVDEITAGLVYDGVENESNHNYAMIFNLADGYEYSLIPLDDDEQEEKLGFIAVDKFEVLYFDAEYLGLAAGHYYPAEDNECLYWVEYSSK